MPDELTQVLNNAIKALNYIKADALNSRLFAELCKESNSMSENTLFHTGVRWLLKGKVLKKSFSFAEANTGISM